MNDRNRAVNIPDVKTDNSDKIKLELDKLSKKGQPTPADIIELYNKYGDNEAIVDEILKLNTKRYDKIKKQAKELAKKIYKKFSSGNKPLHEILNKMMKYKSENHWTDSEYDEFRKELSYLLTGNRALEIDYNQNLVSNKSRINRALGNTQIVMDEGLHIKDTEQPVLAEILNMYEKSLSLHKSIFMHSLMYEDCSLVAMTGEYNRERNISSNYISPILACMFLPKFDIFEMHMLYSNFGAIIKNRYEKKAIINEPDSLLFYDITSDPNDVVCAVSSPITDLKNRYQVQINLWSTILKLRNGNYYDNNPVSEFLTALNKCRNNLYDNADLAYSQDEGAILRRLLSVFSLRPTVIYTKPISSIASYINPFNTPLPNSSDINANLGSGFGQNNYFNSQPVYTITAIPMITLQIPPYTEGAEPKDLRTATSQTIWINENKTIVPKEQSIIYSKEVLIFYVNRRVQRIQIRTFSNPLSFSQLPLSMSSFEKLNKYPINVPDRLSIGRSEETYHLRSVVAVSETEIKQGDKMTNLITGSVGLIMSHRDFNQGIYEAKYYLYDPFGASLPVKSPNEDGYFTNKPISMIEPIMSLPQTPDSQPNPSFFDRASKNGTIYIYAKPTGYKPNEIISV